MSAQSKASKERGTALVEFAIFLPALVAFIIGIVEIGNAVVTYLSLTHIAREGVRVATSIPDLESGSFQNVYMSGNAYCITTSGINNLCKNHLILQRRMALLSDWEEISENSQAAQDNYMYQYEQRVLHATTSLDTDADGNETVAVELGLRYPIVYGVFGHTMLRVRAQGPYLL